MALATRERLDPPVVHAPDARFRVISRLGAGASGTVYEVHDARLGQTVAAKTLHDTDADSLYALKKEFRVLRDLRHPNLVRLYELFADLESPFFTMELVAGTHLIDYVRGRSAPLRAAADMERLGDVVRQLGSALGFLHAEGKLHRDIKPSNVRIERTGRAVLLDFGLASDLRSHLSARSRAGEMAGTFAYMSPEQASGAAVGAASDWYSVGVVLFEALTGRLPAEPRHLRDLLKRSEAPAPGPRDVDPSVPASVDALVRALLDPDPGKRPGSAEVVERCAEWATERAPLSLPAPRESTFVGRGEELEALGEALAASRKGPTLVEICGPSGIGKTALVERFLRAQESSFAGVLRSRCHPRETVPFKALDGVVDDLARVLGQLPKEERAGVLPRYASALVMVFPVMGRVPGLVQDDSSIPHERTDLHRQAFASLREVLGRLADRGPLVLWIDDAQWGDSDSRGVLEHLCREPDAPRILIALAHRPDAVEGGGAEALELVEALRAQGVAHRRLELEPLAEDALGALVREEIEGRGGVAGKALVEGILASARGSPMLALELTRSSERHPSARSDVSLLRSLIHSRAAQLGPAGTDLAELLAVAGHPIDESVLKGPLRRELRDVWALVEEQLVALAPGGTGVAVGLRHDAIRDAVLAGIGSERLRALHLELAEAFERAPGRYDDSLIGHWMAAGHPERAARAAVELGAGAMKAGAFGRAAGHYARALELPSLRYPRWVLMSRMAAALIDGGRLSDAAPLLEQAAEELRSRDPDDPQHLALRRRAAAAYLRGGSYRDGRRVLSEASDYVGVRFPRSPSEALLRTLWLRLRLAHWRRRGASVRDAALGPEEQERLDLCWEAAQSLRFIDVARSSTYQAQHALLARRYGEPRHVASSLAVDALLRAFRLGDVGWAKTESMLIESERLSQESEDPRVIAHSQLMHASSLGLVTRWTEALELAESGERYCRSECRGARWELATFHQVQLMSLAMRGEYEVLRQHLDQWLSEAEDLGDEFAATLLPIGIQNLTWLGADDPDEAERRVEKAIGPSFGQGSLWYLFHGEIARGHIDLYRGDAGAALERTRKLWKRLRRGGFLQSQSVRILVRDLDGRTSLLAAEQAPEGSRREELLRRTERTARKMRGERCDWVEPCSARLEGGVLGLRGEEAGARELLERAALGFHHQQLGVLAAGTRCRVAALGRDERSRALETEAHDWLRQHGVRNPSRMIPLC